MLILVWVWKIIHGSSRKKSTYDTDIFSDLINEILNYDFIYGKEEEKDIAIRVVVDILELFLLLLQMANYQTMLGQGM